MTTCKCADTYPRTSVHGGEPWPVLGPSQSVREADNEGDNETIEFIEEAGLSGLLEKWRDIADIDARIIQQTQGRGTDPLFAATFG
ncbi:MAG TPA: hypothetical protein VK540_09665 [Polyangiaceae bacterium]|nr:hypothetical protein [Polyangiaceae bacterium]